MKTIVCGPPHSGKSVLINSLYSLLPSDDSLTIRANGDGEGLWTNNPNQQEVDTVRKQNKSGNTSADFEVWRHRVETVRQRIVLVDIGGRLSDDKIPLFETCDTFIVISSDAQMKERWMQFGTAHGCRCLAIIDSTLNKDDDTVLSEKPFFTARLGGLDRGANLSEKKTVRGLANMLIQKSGYKNIVYVNCYKLGEELGCAKSWIASNGVKVSNVFFQRDKALELSKHLKVDYEPGVHYRLFGANANWVAAIAAAALADDNPSNISFYDRWSGKYISPSLLAKAENPQNDDINIKVTEDESTVRLDFTMKSLDLDTENFVNYQLPVIDEQKTLLVSGRFPNWFTVSVMMSYRNKEKYFRIPGLTSSYIENYVCVVSDDERNLGQIFKS